MGRFAGTLKVGILVLVKTFFNTQFQNIHLVRKWLPALEKKLEFYSEGSHDNYRVFISAEPAATASGLLFFLPSIGVFSPELKF